jgi:hypothetical protein
VRLFLLLCTVPGADDTPIDRSATRAAITPRGAIMNRLTSVALAGLVLSTCAASAALAQVRTESPTSPFTYEALGATPRITAFDRTPDSRAMRGDAVAAGSARAEKPRTEPVRTPALTYDALGATPSLAPMRPPVASPAAR